ncbi:MAG TPA: DUF4097 family beta strand repeat-containing protein [Gaiellales bacterium]|jgi:DUF4097 and DUF4098 domain-containing protein YvlB|nr:DUF4097 family beta strand repeat-containing protein [Gaiellales bacterium]
MPTTTHHTPGPLDLEIRAPSGRIEIETADITDTVVEAEPLSSSEASAAAAAAVRQDLRQAGDGQRLRIEVPKQRSRLFGWAEPDVLVRVRCPHGTDVSAHTASADVDLRGRAGSFQARTAAGDVTAETVAGDSDVKTASGDVSLGSVGGRTSANTMSGDVVVEEAGGSVAAHTMSGDVRVERIARGSAEVRTMSGDIVVSVRPGATLWIDAGSMSGEVSSELPVSDAPPAGGTADIELRASSMSGDIDLRRSEEASPAGA